MVGILLDDAQLGEKLDLMPPSAWNTSTSSNALGGALAICGPSRTTGGNYVDLAFYGEPSVGC